MLALLVRRHRDVAERNTATQRRFLFPAPIHIPHQPAHTHTRRVASNVAEVFNRTIWHAKQRRKQTQQKHQTRRGALFNAQNTFRAIFAKIKNQQCSIFTHAFKHRRETHYLSPSRRAPPCQVSLTRERHFRTHTRAQGDHSFRAIHAAPLCMARCLKSRAPQIFPILHICLSFSGLCPPPVCFAVF